MVVMLLMVPSEVWVAIGLLVMWQYETLPPAEIWMILGLVLEGTTAVQRPVLGFLTSVVVAVEECRVSVRSHSVPDSFQRRTCCKEP
jgi:hypothetical protein